MDKKLKWILFAIVFLSFLGFLDASYLTLERYRGGVLPCYIFETCDLVTNSAYGTIFGVPVSFAGVGYYLFVFIAALYYLDTRNRLALFVVKYLPIAGLLAALWFTYLQVFVLNAFCFYCLISAGLSTAIFVLSIFVISPVGRPLSLREEGMRVTKQ